MLWSLYKNWLLIRVKSGSIRNFFGLVGFRSGMIDSRSGFESKPFDKKYLNLEKSDYFKNVKVVTGYVLTL
jgi:hypothetical protein